MHLRHLARGALVGLAGALCLGLCGCGGGDSGEPLLSGSLTAEYAGDSFTPDSGYATIYQDAGLIALGDGPIHCGTENQQLPPSGDNVVISLPNLDVGDYGSVFVELLRSAGGNLDGNGSNSGTVTITDSTSDAVAGSVEYDYTDSQTGDHYAISGTFEVTRCAP